jgi:hypothetical protein
VLTVANIRKQSRLAGLEAYQLGRFSFNNKLLLFEILNAKEHISLCSAGLEGRQTGGQKNGGNIP